MHIIPNLITNTNGLVTPKMDHYLTLQDWRRKMKVWTFFNRKLTKSAL